MAKAGFTRPASMAALAAPACLKISRRLGIFILHFAKAPDADESIYTLLRPDMSEISTSPSAAASTKTRKEIIAWWESGRLRFNLYVGAVGVVTWFLVLIAGSAAVKPGVDFEEPLAMIFGAFLYAFFANCCYTLGWLVDTSCYRAAPRVRLYRAGLIFSIVLAALPGIWAVVAWLITVITGQKLD